MEAYKKQHGQYPTPGELEQFLETYIDSQVPTASLG